MISKTGWENNRKKNVANVERDMLGAMVKHMKEKHDEKLKCNICDEELKTEKTLENHYAKKHIVNTIAFL